MGMCCVFLRDELEFYVIHVSLRFRVLICLSARPLVFEGLSPPPPSPALWNVPEAGSLLTAL